MTKLPTTGPLPKPKSPEEAREVLKAEAFPAPDAQRVALTATEFTSICPRTGQPDFGSVEIEYAPHERCLESKALKYYLWSFRDEARSARASPRGSPTTWCTRSRRGRCVCACTRTSAAASRCSP